MLTQTLSLDRYLAGSLPTEAEALALANNHDTAALTEIAARLRDNGHHNVITYSKKVFIPLTYLCRDVCHYCTFAQTPKHIESPFMPPEQVLASAREAATLGCKEALFTLGEKPELRYKAARQALAEMGYSSTLEYLFDIAGQVFRETGLLPHLNPGNMDQAEITQLKKVSPSMGIMLESAATRLTEKGMPHYGSPDKVPATRLETIALAGKNQVPFTTGILIGIGETRRERIESLLALRKLHTEYGHIQEIIVQNFRAKPGTKMSQAPEPDLDELLWSIAVARIIFGANMSIQAPPNLSPGVLPQLIQAGINDWGGVSPVTPDFVNPEAPWPHLDELARETSASGKLLQERLTIYPDYIKTEGWLDKDLQTQVMHLSDASGYPRIDNWSPGEDDSLPRRELDLIQKKPAHISVDIAQILSRVTDHNMLLNEQEIVRLFNARGDDFSAVTQAANEIRKSVNGDTVTFVVNRNINYTNVCYFKCQFCAFSKGKLSENLRGRPYDLSADEIARRVKEAWARGGTEVCMQGGIHPEYTGSTYLDILKTVKQAEPEMHVHAFSPLEVWQGAATSNMSLERYLSELKSAGLNTLPGTAAEILDDEIRDIICPDKINTEQWLEVMETAHKVGFKTTATIMYGHVESPQNWARHLIQIRDLQIKTGGFTEFVPLPFVHMEAPMYLRGKARKGPTFRESILMHSVARLVLHPHISNIQASWVKLGYEGVIACLSAGCNDLGGTLMNESITRAAGAEHGQETSPQAMIQLIESANRIARQRSTDYGEVSQPMKEIALAAGALSEAINTPTKKYERKRKGPLLRNAPQNLIPVKYDNRGS